MRYLIAILVVVCAIQIGYSQSQRVRYQKKLFFFDDHKTYSLQEVCAMEDLTKEEYSACQQIQRAHKNALVAKRITGVMGVVTMIALITSNRYEYYDHVVHDIVAKSGFIFGTMAVFVTAGIITVVKMSQEKRSIRNFVDTYNRRSYQKDTGVELKLGTTPNGVGLVLNF